MALTSRLLALFAECWPPNPVRMFAEPGSNSLYYAPPSWKATTFLCPEEGLFGVDIEDSVLEGEVRTERLEDVAFDFG